MNKTSAITVKINTQTAFKNMERKKSVKILCRRGVIFGHYRARSASSHARPFWLTNHHQLTQSFLSVFMLSSAMTLRQILFPSFLSVRSRMPASLWVLSLSLS